MFNPIGAADHPPTDITLRGKLDKSKHPALRVMSNQRKLRGSAAPAKKSDGKSNGETLKTGNSTLS